MARYDWEKIRAEYEVGSSMGELSRRYGVTKSAISQRAKKEGWLQDVSGVVDRLAEAKLNGVLNTVNPQKKAEALSRAAEDKAAVIRNHREAWDGFKQDVKAALEANDFDRLKCLKIASETLRNAQECERKAWGIQDKAVEAENGRPSSQAVAVNIDFSGMTPEQINELGEAMLKVAQ